MPHEDCMDEPLATVYAGRATLSNSLTLLQEGTFRGRTALVTGGGTGIGAGIATELVRLCADVVIASRKPEHYEQGAEAIRAAGVNVVGMPLDIREPDDVDRVLERAEATFGRPVSLLVNNAAAN